MMLMAFRMTMRLIQRHRMKLATASTTDDRADITSPGRLWPLGRWGINQHGELAVVERA